VAKLVRYAWFVLVFNVAVIAFGAFVRATGSGAGCGPSWPTCRPALNAGGETARAIELTHRGTAGLALVLVVILAFLVWRNTTKGHPARTGAALSVVAIVGEALIGAMIVLAEWVAQDASVARAVAVPLHLVNTLFLLAALTMTIFWLSGGNRLDFRLDTRITRWVLLGGLALVLITATGAITALADTLFPKGAGTDPTTDAQFLTQLRVVHPILAIVASAIGWMVASRSERGRGVAASALPFIVGLMLVSGVINVAIGVPVWMQLVHLALADSLWIAYVFVSARALQPSEVTASRLSPSR
jgi:heme A synthase